MGAMERKYPVDSRVIVDYPDRDVNAILQEESLPTDSTLAPNLPPIAGVMIDPHLLYERTMHINLGEDL